MIGIGSVARLSERRGRCPLNVHARDDELCLEGTVFIRRTPVRLCRGRAFGTDFEQGDVLFVYELCGLIASVMDC